MLRRLVSRLGDESGIALVLALSAMLVLTMIAGTTIYYSSTSERESSQSRAADTAYRLAETGINNAMATLGNSQTSALDSGALPSSESAATWQTYASGEAKTWGTLNTSTKVWTLYGKGQVTGGASQSRVVTRTLTATMQVSYSYKQPVNAQAWNYVYITNTGGPNTCDLTLVNTNGQSGNGFDAPLYVDGNLCLSNNANIREDLISPKIPVNVVVKGKVAFSTNSKIGVSSSNTVTAVYISGGCGTSLSNVHTCTTGGGNNDPIYPGSGGFSTQTPSVSAPAVDWVNDGWYTNASPGPNHPCSTVSGTPPSFESTTAPYSTQQDISGTYPNGSLTTTQNLTPSTSYTCQTGIGELSWNASTHTMTVNGVIYIDGNVSIGDGSVDEYNGQATLYASGYITVTGTMCGKRNSTNTGCDFSNWDPNTEMWILAAHGNDGNGYSVVFPQNATWEGGIYATKSVNLLNNATVEGPLIAGSASFSNNVTERPFPVITTVPEGAPGNPNVYAQPNPPGGYSG